MIPVKLSIEGLYSYQQRQTIDFTELISAGIFGVFGAVGSGKSSILEAITFALYGETERLNARERRPYNMMNLKSKRSYIEFDFLNFENKLFRATREFKRNSKNFADVKATAAFYEIKDGVAVPLEHTNAEKVLGLSYQNFKRTIIIPQGQFREFLELGPSDRTTMMKEIFQLHRYDLSVKELKDENKSALDQLTGQLTGFEEVSAEQLMILDDAFQNAEDDRKIREKDFNIINAMLENQKLLKKDFEELKIKNEQLNIFKFKKENIDERKKELEEFEKAVHIFRQLFIDRHRENKELKIQTGEHQKIKSEIEKRQKEFDKIEQQLEEIRNLFEDLPKKRQMENELKWILEAKKIAEKSTILEKILEAGEARKNDLQTALTSIEADIFHYEQSIEKKSEQLLDHEELMAVQNWFAERRRIENLKKELEQNCQDCDAQINELNSQLQQFKIDITAESADFSEKINELKQQKATLFSKKQHLEVQMQLSKYSEHLHNGEKCPLCGSQEHPDIVELEDVSGEYSTTQDELEKLEILENELQKEMTRTLEIFTQRKLHSNQRSGAFEKLQKAELEAQQHVAAFAWNQHDSSNEKAFTEKISLNKALNNEVDQLRKKLGKCREEFTKVNKEQDKINGELQEKRLETRELQTSYREIISRLEILTYNEYSHFPESEFEDKIVLLKIENDRTEKQFQNLTEEKQRVHQFLISKNAKAEEIERTVKKLEKGVQHITAHIQIETQKENTTEENVLKILEKKLNILGIRQEIFDFEKELYSLENAIRSLTKKLDGNAFDEEKFELLEQQVHEAQLALNKIREETAVKKQEVDSMRLKLQKMDNLLADKKKLEIRQTNLQTLDNLFKGQGFVNYVSTIYLQNLCDHANERFHRMTRNQLSLQVNQSGDFEIIDYLNEGRTRSVKTLSGGQSFQVSLCLALALAESVQANARADRNFFFIDEGFGTQDPESVNTVFDTLMDLRHENRIVGIISHVEELKEKIPVALNIIKDPERGSLVKID